MATKSRNSQQMELFEGNTVEKYQLAFKGAFSSDEVAADDLGMGDHVCLLVIASVGEATFRKNNDDEVLRVNKLEVLRAVELDPKIAEYALAKHAATQGAPMLPNFTDPDDDELDEFRPTDVGTLPDLDDDLEDAPALPEPRYEDDQ